MLVRTCCSSSPHSMSPLGTNRLPAESFLSFLLNADHKGIHFSAVLHKKLSALQRSESSFDQRSAQQAFLNICHFSAVPCHVIKNVDFLHSVKRAAMICSRCVAALILQALQRSILQALVCIRKHSPLCIPNP